MRSHGRRVLGVLLSVLALVVLGSAPAQAEDGDRISRFDISYTILPDGAVEVVEDIDYVFAEEGRHGIFRSLTTRLPYGDGSDRDVLYTIRDIEVTSPQAPDEWDDSTRNEGFRRSWLVLQIGDEDETLETTTASYRISYVIEGALRTVDGVPELYWNATGNDWEAAIDEVTVRVSSPDGVTSLSCYEGEAGSTEQCATRTESGVAVAEARGLAPGEGVTISAQVPAGSVSNAEPDVVPGGTFMRAARPSPLTVGGSALALVLSVLAAVWTRRTNRDQRYAGVAPGTIEPSAPVTQDTLSTESIPVRFNPPDVGPAVGGVLLSSSASSKVTAATLIELAHAGALRIEATPREGKKFEKSGGVQRTAVAADLSKAPDGYAATFATKLFEDGDRIVLDEPEDADTKRWQEASEPLVKQVTDTPRERGWRVHRSSSTVIGLALGFVAVLALIGISFGILGRGALLYLAPLGLAAIALVVAIVLWAAGYFTAEGRARADQVQGFKRYIETAEARTLRFEEGQDIFSAYLPWAIVFGLADRWQKVCAELAAAGRIPDEPAWYVGPAFYSTFSGSSASSFGESFASSVTTASASASSSGSGGSGFSGGGGGGGGGGSW
ncbi:MAG: DUF2207 domain-containing protein [Actinomycetia bacterium]|nr:DUF2207 domain-containing protein [Actinomycetes bacterium]